VLEEFLGKDSVSSLLAKDFVDCKIDQDEMKNGQVVAAALRANKQGGIPWFVILDPSKPILADAGDGKWKRRNAAVLSTADGPNGNVGCPIRLQERQHFLACLAAARTSLTDEELLQIADAQFQFANTQTKGEETESITTLPEPPRSFESMDAAVWAFYEKNPEGLFDHFREVFPSFRQLAKNPLAPPNDRGQAYLFCFKFFFATIDDWKKPGKILDSLATTLTEDWADASWSESLAEAIAKNHELGGFDAGPHLTALERTTTLADRKAEAAYQRVLSYQHESVQALKQAVDHFASSYPEDSRLSEVHGFLQEFTKIQVDHVAPGFTGADVDGNPISLSDYKGKVTYLVFWGFW